MNKKKIRSLGVAGILLGLSIVGAGYACFSQKYFTDDQRVQAEKATVAAKACKPTKAFAKGMNNFSYGLYEQLQDGKNVFISPYSASMALSMLNVGAKGTTKAEMESVLGIKDFDKWNSYCKWWVEKEQGANTKMYTANSVWLSDQITLAKGAKKNFFNPLSVYFHGEKNVRALDTEETKEAINSWTKKHTDGMIPQILSQPLSSDISMMLINAVSFDGKWQYPFEVADTMDRVFYGTEKESKVPMMSQYGKRYKYVTAQNLRALEVPYKDGEYVMDLFLAKDKKQSAPEIFLALSTKNKDKLFKEMDQAASKEIRNFVLPKMDIEYEKSLAAVLQNMGMKKAFGNADFSKFAEDQRISDVYQKAVIKVDEQGTKAAAVTSVMVETNSVRPIEKPIDFVADHPFVYVIRHKETGTILFIGCMQNM